MVDPKLSDLYVDMLNEKRTKNVIVVDVQPIYNDAIHFDIDDLSSFLLDNRDILFFYNGVDTIGGDSKEDIVYMFTDNYYDPDYASDISDKLETQTTWIDKGYGFFRSWMDIGADIGFIQKAIIYMVINNVTDSRDIDPEDWYNEFPDDFCDEYIDDNIYLPDIPISELRMWNGSYLLGGGQDECLKDIQIYMNAFIIKYTLVDKFIY
jgi:hypothetical protein